MPTLEIGKLKGLGLLDLSNCKYSLQMLNAISMKTFGFGSSVKMFNFSKN